MKMVFSRAWFGFAMVAAALVLSGCSGKSSDDDDDEDGDGSGDPDSYCSRAVGKFNACGMGPLAGELDDNCEEPDNARDRCYFQCALVASCDAIRQTVCSGELSPDLEACYDGCEPPPFACGSGETLPEEYTCDGFADCLDGSDERAGCPTCGSGETLPDYWLCDGFPDCADGFDERGCPMFTCRNGDSLPESAECDFFVDCADGSDEHAACPNVFICANGQRFPDYFECDNYPDCTDGSDEHAGCPRVTCADGTTTSGTRCDDNEDCFDGSDEPASCPPSARDQVCGAQ